MAPGTREVLTVVDNELELDTTGRRGAKRCREVQVWALVATVGHRTLLVVSVPWDPHVKLLLKLVIDGHSVLGARRCLDLSDAGLGRILRAALWLLLLTCGKLADGLGAVGFFRDLIVVEWQSLPTGLFHTIHCHIDHFIIQALVNVK